MNFLLDTSVFLWVLLDSPELSANARQAIRDGDKETLIKSLPKPVRPRISLNTLDSGLRWNDDHGLIQRFHNGIYLSVVSVWEILIKHKLGKLPLPGGVAPERF